MTEISVLLAGAKPIIMWLLTIIQAGIIVIAKLYYEKYKTEQELQNGKIQSNKTSIQTSGQSFEILSAESIKIRKQIDDQLDYIKDLIRECEERSLLKTEARISSLDSLMKERMANVVMATEKRIEDFYIEADRIRETEKVVYQNQRDIEWIKENEKR